MNDLNEVVRRKEDCDFVQRKSYWLLHSERRVVRDRAHPKVIRRAKVRLTVLSIQYAYTMLHRCARVSICEQSTGHAMHCRSSKTRSHPTSAGHLGARLPAPAGPSVHNTLPVKKDRGSRPFAAGHLWVNLPALAGPVYAIDTLLVKRDRGSHPFAAGHLRDNLPAPAGLVYVIHCW